MEAVEGRQIGEKSWLNSTAGISFECYMFDCEKSRKYGVADHRSRLRAVRHPARCSGKLI